MQLEPKDKESFCFEPSAKEHARQVSNNSKASDNSYRRYWNRQSSHGSGGSRASFAQTYEQTEDSLSFTKAKPTISAGIFNLANTIMGASLMGLPFVAKAGGLVPYIAFMTFSVAVGYTTVCFLVNSLPYVASGKKDFQAVARAALGKHGSTVTALATWLSCYGAMTAYLVLTGIQGPFVCELVGLKPAPEPWVVQAGVCMFILVPLCLLQDISALAPTSCVAVIVCIGVALTAVYFCVYGDDFYSSSDIGMDGKPSLPAPPADLLLSPSVFSWVSLSQFGTVLMAFNCQYAFLPIVEKFPAERHADMKRVGLGGLLTAYVSNLTLGVCAYTAYQAYTKGMILLNFRHCYERCEVPIGLPGMPLECPVEHIQSICTDENTFISILNGLFLFSVLMGYPCTHFACRKAQIALTLGLDTPFSWQAHSTIGIANILATLGIAIAVGTNVTTVFKWTGAIASPLLSLILPSGFYFKILGNNGVPFCTTKRLSALAILLYGFGIVVFLVTCNIMAP